MTHMRLKSLIISIIHEEVLGVKPLLFLFDKKPAVEDVRIRAHPQTAGMMGTGQAFSPFPFAIASKRFFQSATERLDPF